MATMIPAVIPDASEPEQMVFRLLRDDPATEGWVIMHGVKTPSSEQQQRTIDFVALVPDSAILCLEVRGGGFEVKSGQWYALSTRELVEPPGRQVEKAMYELDSELRAHFPGWCGDAELPIDSVVLFTDTTWPPHLRPLSYPTIGLPDLEIHAHKTVGQRLGEIAAEIRDDLPDSAPPDPATVRAVQDYLASQLSLAY